MIIFGPMQHLEVHMYNFAVQWILVYLFISWYDNKCIGVEVAVDWTSLHCACHPLAGGWLKHLI